VRIVQQVGASEERSRRKEGGEGGGIGADADLGETALRGARAIHLEVSGQFGEGHSGDHIEQTGENEAEVVGVGGGVLVVGFGHPVLHGVNPLSLSSRRLYTQPAQTVNPFCHFFLKKIFVRTT